MKNGRKKGLVLLLFLLGILVGIVYIGTEIFQVKKIIVSGNEKMVYDDIVRIAGIPMGENIFKVDKALIQKRIEKNPYLEFVSMDFEYPDSICIHIRERKPAAAIPYLGSQIVVDTKGFILEICGDLEDMPYPLVQGLSIKGCTIGKELAVADLYQLKALKRVLEEVYKQELQDVISEIQVDNPDNIYIISRNGTTIRLGQAIEVNDKLKWLRTSNFHQIDNGDIKGVLDISVATQAIFQPVEN